VKNIKHMFWDCKKPQSNCGQSCKHRDLGEEVLQKQTVILKKRGVFFEKQLFRNKKVVQKKQPLEVSQDQLVLPATENIRYNCSSQLLRREGMIRREQLAAEKETYVRSR
jgi:hypothetical protein